MKKLFGTDLDGTLVKLNFMKFANYKYIKRLTSLNHCLAIATGRPFNQVGFLKKLYGIDADYFILLNGALIIDKHRNIVKHESISLETVSRILSATHKEGWKVSLHTGFRTFAINSGLAEFLLGKKSISSLEQIKHYKISAISIVYRGRYKKDIDAVCNLINTTFGDKVSTFRNVNYLDIVPLNCSKGTGIEYVRQRESIEKKDVFTIGDSWNDVSMFEITDNSFTVRTAEKLIHTKANYVVNSVGHCIKDFVIK